jgi:hypothetical protein
MKQQHRPRPCLPRQKPWRSLWPGGFAYPGFPWPPSILEELREVFCWPPRPPLSTIVDKPPEDDAA